MEGFLPPKPPGPEPELGGRPAGTWQPPAEARPEPGAPGTEPRAPGTEPHPAGPQPDNGPAVAGFVFSLIAAGLLFVTAGLSSVVSLGCAIAGLLYSRRGKRNVETGVSPKHGGLAQAGWVLGWIGLVVSILATIAWILVLVLGLTSEEFRRELERELESRTSMRLP